MPTTESPQTKAEFAPITGYLVVTKFDDAVKYYSDVFGAQEAERHQDPSGKVWHAQLLLMGVRLLLMEPFEDMELVAPGRRGAASAASKGDSSMLMVFVPNVDEAFDRALRAGGTPIIKPWDSFWGDRYAEFRDPFGHRWALNYPLEPQTAEQRLRHFEEWRRRHGDLKSPAPVVKEGANKA